MNGIDKLKATILTQNKFAVLEALTELQEEVAINRDTMITLCTPVCITELHKMLVENLGVNQKLMRLNARIPNARRRANLFAQAMINGVNYLKDE